LTEEQSAKVREAVRRQVQTFARELVSSLQFYQNQPVSLAIGEIVLTGGTMHLEGLAEELERLIGVRVRVGDPLNRVTGSKRVAEAAYHVGSLAVAIGLGIEDGSNHESRQPPPAERSASRARQGADDRDRRRDGNGRRRHRPAGGQLPYGELEGAPGEERP